MPENVSLCAATVRTDGGLLTIPDTLAGERWRSHPFVTGGPDLRFYAGAAITVSDEPIGVVCVFGDQPREFGEEQQRALVALAAQTSAQLQLRQHNSRLRDLAATDALTGLGNRRALNTDLATAVTQLTTEWPCRRAPRPKAAARSRLPIRAGEVRLWGTDRAVSTRSFCLVEGVVCTGDQRVDVFLTVPGGAADRARLTIGDFAM